MAFFWEFALASNLSPRAKYPYCSRQTFSFVVTSHIVQLLNIFWKFDDLIVHIHKHVQKSKEEMSNVQSGDFTQYPAQAKSSAPCHRP